MQVGVWRSDISTTGAFWARGVYWSWALCESGLGRRPIACFPDRAPSQGLIVSRYQLCPLSWFCEHPCGDHLQSPAQQQWRTAHDFCLHATLLGRLSALHFYQRAEIGTHLHLIALDQCLSIKQGDRGISVKELQRLIHTCCMELFHQVTPVNYQIFNATDKSNNALSVGSAGI